MLILEGGGRWYFPLGLICGEVWAGLAGEGGSTPFSSSHLSSLFFSSSSSSCHSFIGSSVVD